MRLNQAAAALIALGAVLLAGASAGQTIADDGGAPLRSDTAIELSNGSRFVAPRNWLVRREGGAVILTAPERDSHIAVLDTGETGADAALRTAWSVYRPSPAPAGSASPRRAREGWDETVRYQYEAPQVAGRSLTALALRKGQHWTILIQDLSDVVAGRRDAELEVIVNSLLPRGYARESFAGRTAHRLDETRIAALIELIETGRREFDIPGVALGLIEDGEIVYAGGFGVRALGQSDPVDEETLFNIASNGKALTTLMLARLVDEGRLDWDTPVQSLWPQFRLGDAETTARTEVRHLICACTGMPRQDYEWLFEGDASSAASMMELLWRAEPTSGFGDTYQYSNLMAAAAGYLGARTLYPRRELGRGYDEAMQSLVFDPLGMRSTAPVSARPRRGNYAEGHASDIHGVVRLADQGFNAAAITTRPSGNHWSNVADMLRYIRMELAEGLLPDGRRYVSREALLARYEPQVTEGLNEYYGMGLKIDRQWGVTVIHHGGSASGYRSDMIWLPEHGVGAVILTNSDTGSALRAAFRRRLLEVLFDGQPTAGDFLVSNARAWRAGVAEQAEALTIPADPAAARALARRYNSAELGALHVISRDGSTWFDFGGWESEAATHAGEEGAVSFITISPGLDGLAFTPANADGTRRLVVREGEREYIFNEVR